MTRRAKPPDQALPAPAPDQAALRRAAIAHLACYAATRAGLLRVLERRIDRWARTALAGEDAADIAPNAATAREAARRVVADLAAEGAISDAAFAEQRVRRLVRGGRSRQAVAAHLAARGVGRDTAQAVLPDDPRKELAAALALARRRRLGPFRAEPADAESRARSLSVLARAGFSRGIAEQALDADPAEAEQLVAWLRDI